MEAWAGCDDASDPPDHRIVCPWFEFFFNSEGLPRRQLCVIYNSISCNATFFHDFEWIWRFSKVPNKGALRRSQGLGVFLSVWSSNWISKSRLFQPFFEQTGKRHGFAVVIMASLSVAILALSAHEQDVRKRAALFTLAHYYKSRSNRQNASIRRAKRMRVVQQILFWFIRRDIPDGLYANFQSLIQLLIQRAPEHKFRAAFRL